MRDRTLLFSLLANLILITALFSKGCTGCNNPCNGDTTIKYDTVYIPVKTPEVSQKTKEVAFSDHGKVTKGKAPAPIEPLVNQPADSAKPKSAYVLYLESISQDYYRRIFYADTLQYPYGKVYLSYSTYRNRVDTLKHHADFDIPQITKTVTIHQPKRTIGYIGWKVSGNAQSPLFSTGLRLSLKNKQEFIYSVGADYILDSRINAYNQDKLLLTIGADLPIRLSKRNR